MHAELCTSVKISLERCFSGPPKETEDKRPWVSGFPSIYDCVEDEEAFLSGMKRRLFFQTLKIIFEFHKHPWAKLTVSQALKKVYLEK